MTLKKINKEDIKIEHDIIEIENAIDKDICSFIIETIEKYPKWEDATTFGNVPEYRKTEVDYITQRYGFNSELFWVHSILGYTFKICFEEIQKLYKKEDGESHIHYAGDEGFQILKYQPGCYYKEHIDAGPNVKRTISTILYLNDDFKGGETYFPRQNKTVDIKTGKVIFFPSTYTHPHIAKDVEEGTKYNSVIWSF